MAGEGRVGACHGIDIPYFFERLDASFWSSLYRGAGDVALARAYRRAMVAMAKTGSPAHPGLPAWPAWDPERRATMVFDGSCAVMDDPDGERRRLFDGAPAYGYPGAVA